MSNWYLLRNGETHGPYPEEQMREWVRAGQVAPDEKLNREGDPNWLSLDMIPEFAADRLAAPAVAPPPTMGGVPYVPATPAPVGYGGNPPKDRTVAAILAILLGGLGIHHFYLGNTTIGVIYIVLACLGVSPILGLVDGIIYLTKPEDVFQRNCHNWFCSGV